jgi:hypothetical protein
LAERLLAADLVEPPLLLVRLRCELALVELLLELVPFFAPDDERFALDDEPGLLRLLVCAMDRPPSRLKFPLFSGDLTSVPAQFAANLDWGQKSPAKSQVRPVGQPPLRSVGLLCE